jgi:uncharacterized protein (DUF4415 family)
MPVKKRASRPDLKRIDAHLIQPHEYDDAPELTDATIDRAVRMRGGKPVKIGRPLSGSAPKEIVTLRLPPDVLAYFRGTGKGWQTRVGDVLARVAKRGQVKPKRRAKA